MVGMSSRSRLTFRSVSAMATSTSRGSAGFGVRNRSGVFGCSATGPLASLIGVTSSSTRCYSLAIPSDTLQLLCTAIGEMQYHRELYLASSAWMRRSTDFIVFLSGLASAPSLQAVRASAASPSPVELGCYDLFTSACARAAIFGLSRRCQVASDGTLKGT